MNGELTRRDAARATALAEVLTWIDENPKATVTELRALIEERRRFWQSWADRDVGLKL